MLSLRRGYYMAYRSYLASQPDCKEGYCSRFVPAKDRSVDVGSQETKRQELYWQVIERSRIHCTVLWMRTDLENVRIETVDEEEAAQFAHPVLG